MRFWNKLSRKDRYVEECFQIDFQELSDDRDFKAIPEAKAVVTAHRGGKIKEAFNLAKKLKEKYPDYYFPYSWLGFLYYEQREFQYEQKAFNLAKSTFLEGLRLSKKKHPLCEDMADMEWRQWNLGEAIKWWIRTAVLQVSIRNSNKNRQEGSSTPFLYLSHVAAALGLREETLMLRDLGISYAPIMLTNEEVAKIQQSVYVKGTKSMKKAVQRLCKEYLSTIPITHYGPGEIPGYRRRRPI